MSSIPVKLGFLGSDEIAIPFLSELLKKEVNVSIEAILTQPDRKSGRGRELKPNAIKEWALENNLPIRDPLKPGVSEVKWFKELGIDFLLIMAYGHILRPDLLESCPMGCFNLHASLLPAYRGASPIETAIAMGETETGVTLMKVVERMDAGPIIDAEKVTIHNSMTGPELRDAIAKSCVPLITRNSMNLSVGSSTQIEQDENKATYCRKLTKSDGVLDFSLSADELVCRIRAFSFWPGTFFYHNDIPIKVGAAFSNQNVSLQPGEVAGTTEGELLIGTTKYALQVQTLQKPGGKMLPSSEFLRGYDLRKGMELDISKSQPLTVAKK